MMNKENPLSTGAMEATASLTGIVKIPPRLVAMTSSSASAVLPPTVWGPHKREGPVSIWRWHRVA